MDLSNLFEVVVHYLLIGAMISPRYQDGVPIVSALVYMVTHSTRLTVSHDISYQVVIISPSYLLYGLSTMRGYQAYAKVYSDFNL